MARNDTILVDGIIESRISGDASPATKGEAFEFFAFEQILKNFDLSNEELEFGWVDGRDDGGIDGLFFFVNGQMCTDIESFSWPKRNVELIVYIITCKHADAFVQAPLDNLAASIGEFLDFGIEPAALKGAYSRELIQIRETLHTTFKKVASALASMSIKFVYASRGSTSNLGDSVVSRSEQIKSITSSLFSNCDAQFSFLGATELVELSRKVKKFSLTLPFVEVMAQEGGYVVLADLSSYRKFVVDEGGMLRRYLFDANVRDFLGSNRVNDEISKSLSHGGTVNFWWLNNGITILTTKAVVVGKTIQLEDVQIVNGLQTTEAIFNFFSSGGVDVENRSVLVKVICSIDTDMRDRIIQATNNQSLVEISSLHATDKIQRDIEEVLEKSDWYYERRKNYYRNVGRPESRIVTPLYVAAGSVALLLKNPSKSIKLKSKFMRVERSYKLVFSEEVPLQVWPRVVGVFKQVESHLRSIGLGSRSRGDRFLATWRGIISLMVVSKILGKFSYSPNEFCRLDVSKVDEKIVEEVWDFINEHKKIIKEKKEQKVAPSPANEIKNPNFIVTCCQRYGEKHGLPGFEEIGKRSFVVRPPPPVVTPQQASKSIDESVLKQIDEALPAQPWGKGVHIEVAEKLNLRKGLVAVAIDKLVELGRRFKQVDGVVYDSNDNVIAIRE